MRGCMWEGLQKEGLLWPLCKSPMKWCPIKRCPIIKKARANPCFSRTISPDSLYGFDNLSHSVVGDIAQQTIFTLLTSTILLYGAFLTDIVKRAVEKFRHVMHNSVNFGVAINQDQVSRLFVLAVKLTDEIFSFCPHGKRTMGIVQRDIMQILQMR